MINGISRMLFTALLASAVMTAFAAPRPVMRTAPKKQAVKETKKVSAVEKEEGLTAYWPLNGNLKDMSGNEHDLTPIDASVTPEFDSGCISGTQSYLTAKEKGGLTADISGFDPSKGVTISLLFRHDGQNNFTGTLAGFGSDKWATPAYMTGLPSGMFYAKAGSKKHMIRTVRPPAREWAHLALVVPPSGSGETEFRMYLNAKKLDAPDDDKGVKQYMNLEYVSVDGRFTIGEFTGPQALDKNIAEVRVYNRALSVSELEKLAKMRGEPAEY